ncbi:hypothetical protein TNCV_4483201 [Trichonephila clavipes]|nr:hypothetical protein TNCV_4483201 [Trichonephila clavipes]
MSRFLLVKVGWKCHSGPKVSVRGLVRKRDKAPSQTDRICILYILLNGYYDINLWLTKRSSFALGFADGELLAVFKLVSLKRMWLDVFKGPKVAARQWNQFQTSVTVPMKVAQGRHRAKIFAQDRYLALSAQQLLSLLVIFL